MHINLLVGLAVLLAVIWLVSGYRKSRVRPGDMLKDELEKRRLRQELAAKAEERLRLLRAERMKGMEEALQSMLEALSDEDRRAGVLTWRSEGEKIAVSVKKRGSGTAGSAAQDDPEGKDGTFCIRWDIREFDLDLLASSGPFGNMAGEYVLQWKNGIQSRESDLGEFMRMVSEIIADRIA